MIDGPGQIMALGVASESLQIEAPLSNQPHIACVDCEKRFPIVGENFCHHWKMNDGTFSGHTFPGSF